MALRMTTGARQQRYPIHPLMGFRVPFVGGASGSAVQAPTGVGPTLAGQLAGTHPKITCRLCPTLHPAPPRPAPGKPSPRVRCWLCKLNKEPVASFRAGPRICNLCARTYTACVCPHFPSSVAAAIPEVLSHSISCETVPTVKRSPSAGDKARTSLPSGADQRPPTPVPAARVVSPDPPATDPSTARVTARQTRPATKTGRENP